MVTQEDKKLLLKDICARLPYGVRMKGVNEDFVLSSGTSSNRLSYVLNSVKFSTETDFKPYLRPMNSMTDEEVQEIRDRLNSISIGRTITKENFEKCCDFLWFTKMSSFECVSEKMMDVVIDYLDENMFDHRGLIEKGLAIKDQKMLYICNQEKRTS